MFNMRVVILFITFISLPTKLLSLDYPLNIAPEEDYSVCKDMYDSEWYGIPQVIGKKKNSFYVKGDEFWLFRKGQDLVHDFDIHPKNIDVIKSIKNKLKEKNINVVMVFIPTRGHFAAEKVLKGDLINYDLNRSLANYRKMVNSIKREGVYAPDLTQFKRPQGSEALTFYRDHHWNPYGSQLIAKLTADYIKKLPFYADLNKTEFKTSIKGVVVKEGTYNKLVRTVCGNQIQSQKVPRFITESINNDSSADLFSDNVEDSAPEVVLIGTSNSGDAYNFAGFLQQYLQTQVLNTSIIGGGLEQSLYEYLDSTHYKETPPKLIIWEVPAGAYLPMREKLSFNKLLNFSGYGCTSSNLISRKINLREGENEVLVNKNNLNITSSSSSNYIMIDLKFSDISKIEKIKLYAWYMNGSRKNISINLKLITNNRFITELPKMKGNASFLMLETHIQYKNAQGGDIQQAASVDASMCRIIK